MTSAARATLVRNPAAKEFAPSSFIRTCSIMHSNSTNRPPKMAKPLPDETIRFQSFRRICLVDRLPTSVWSRIYTPVMNALITSPKPPPAAADMAALNRHFPSRAELFSGECGTEGVDGGRLYLHQMWQSVVSADRDLAAFRGKQPFPSVRQLLFGLALGLFQFPLFCSFVLLLDQLLLPVEIFDLAADLLFEGDFPGLFPPELFDVFKLLIVQGLLFSQVGKLPLFDPDDAGPFLLDFLDLRFEVNAPLFVILQQPAFGGTHRLRNIIASHEVPEKPHKRAFYATALFLDDLHFGLDLVLRALVAGHFHLVSQLVLLHSQDSRDRLSFDLQLFLLPTEVSQFVQQILGFEQLDIRSMFGSEPFCTLFKLHELPVLTLELLLEFYDLLRLLLEDRLRGRVGVAELVVELTDAGFQLDILGDQLGPSVSFTFLHLLSMDSRQYRSLAEVLQQTKVKQTDARISANNQAIDRIGQVRREYLAETILVGNNFLQNVEGIEAFHNVSTLSLSYNLIVHLSDLLPLGKLPKLARLSLTCNAVALCPIYKPFLCHLLPRLESLDTKPVKNAERHRSFYEHHLTMFQQLVQDNLALRRAKQAEISQKEIEDLLIEDLSAIYREMIGIRGNVEEAWIDALNYLQDEHKKRLILESPLEGIMNQTFAPPQPKAPPQSVTLRSPKAPNQQTRASTPPLSHRSKASTIREQKTKVMSTLQQEMPEYVSTLEKGRSKRLISQGQRHNPERGLDWQDVYKFERNKDRLNDAILLVRKVRVMSCFDMIKQDWIVGNAKCDRLINFLALAYGKHAIASMRCYIQLRKSNIQLFYRSQLLTVILGLRRIFRNSNFSQLQGKTQKVRKLLKRKWMIHFHSRIQRNPYTRLKKHYQRGMTNKKTTKLSLLRIFHLWKQQSTTLKLKRQREKVVFEFIRKRRIFNMILQKRCFLVTKRKLNLRAEAHSFKRILAKHFWCLSKFVRKKKQGKAKCLTLMQSHKKLDLMNCLNAIQFCYRVCIKFKSTQKLLIRRLLLKPYEFIHYEQIFFKKYMKVSKLHEEAIAKKQIYLFSTLKRTIQSKRIFIRIQLNFKTRKQNSLIKSTFFVLHKNMTQNLKQKQKYLYEQLIALSGTVQQTTAEHAQAFKSLVTQNSKLKRQNEQLLARWKLAVRKDREKGQQRFERQLEHEKAKGRSLLRENEQLKLRCMQLKNCRHELERDKDEYQRLVKELTQGYEQKLAKYKLMIKKINFQTPEKE